MAVLASITAFDPDGKVRGHTAHLTLPDYLDWMPIEVKVFWYVERGAGEPMASHLLFNSQGEQRLVTLNKPLRSLTYKELQENDHGLEERTSQFIDREGFSRTPRNQ